MSPTDDGNPNKWLGRYIANYGSKRSNLGLLVVRSNIPQKCKNKRKENKMAIENTSIATTEDSDNKNDQVGNPIITKIKKYLQALEGQLL